MATLFYVVIRGCVQQLWSTAPVDIESIDRNADHDSNSEERQKHGKCDDAFSESWVNKGVLPRTYIILTES
jgi:hypothetical protein